MRRKKAVIRSTADVNLDVNKYKREHRLTSLKPKWGERQLIGDDQKRHIKK